MRADLNDTAVHAVAFTKNGLKHLVGDGAGSHTHRCLARRRPAAAAIVTNAVFSLIGEIGMARAELPRNLAIILGPLVLVADQHRHRRAGGHPLEDT